MTVSVLVVGCGVMGLSTAVNLAKEGYDVTAIDAHEVPSPWSAANDINKIIRCEYSQMLYTEMAVEALREWKSDPLFKDVFVKSGRISITPTKHEGRRKFEKQSLENLKHFPDISSGIRIYKGKKELADIIQVFKNTSLEASDEIKWNPETAYAHSGNALASMYSRAKDLGVKFIFEDDGRAVGTTTEDGETSIIVANGKTYTADKILVCAGASTGYIVDLKSQQTSIALFLTHIQLSNEEYEYYKDMPIVFDGEIGYFFPPDRDTHIMKVCLSGMGATNLIKDPFGHVEKTSLPIYKRENPELTVPSRIPGLAKSLLHKYFPELSDHELFDSRSCWIADTGDSHFIIDKVPNYSNLYVATGDSGHGFKFLPNIGRYITSMLEGTLEPKFSEVWCWRKDSNGPAESKFDWRVMTERPDFSAIDWIKEQLISRSL